MIIYSIYKCVNRSNGKIYIGFDSKWPNRKKIHKSNFKNLDYKFYRAIRKYGWDNFDWELIYQSKEKDHTLKIMEKFFIEEYDSFNKGYNSTLGGEGVFGLKRHFSEEERNHRKNKMIGNTIAKVNKGRLFTEDHKNNLSKSRSGKKFSNQTEKHKQNIRETMGFEVITPIGNFSSIRQAASFLNIPNSTLRRWCKNNKNGYSYQE